MRWIRKKNEPQQLQEWRLKYRNDPNFGYDLLRKDRDAIDAVHSSLLIEQGYICAYTGIGITENSSHIEHLNPQKHCEPMEEVTYKNIVACCPGPNKPDPPYGAKKKDDWPCPKEAHLFISPLDQSCERKFIYSNTGEVKFQDGDEAAKKTIEKLGLNHKDLVKERKGLIQGIIGKTNSLPIKDARKRLKQLTEAKNERLEPFCFVLIPVLEKHIKRIEFIRTQKQRKI